MLALTQMDTILGSPCKESCKLPWFPQFPPSSLPHPFLVEFSLLLLVFPDSRESLQHRRIMASLGSQYAIWLERGVKGWSSCCTTVICKVGLAESSGAHKELIHLPALGSALSTGHDANSPVLDLQKRWEAPGWLQQSTAVKEHSPRLRSQAAIWKCCAITVLLNEGTDTGVHTVLEQLSRVK